MENGIFVNQSKYAKSLVKRFGLDSAKFLYVLILSWLLMIVVPVLIPVFIEAWLVAYFIWMTVSRPDISFSVGVCARC